MGFWQKVKAFFRGYVDAKGRLFLLALSVVAAICYVLGLALSLLCLGVVIVLVVWGAVRYACRPASAAKVKVDVKTESINPKLIQSLVQKKPAKEADLPLMVDDVPLDPDFFSKGDRYGFNTESFSCDDPKDSLSFHYKGSDVRGELIKGYVGRLPQCFYRKRVFVPEERIQEIGKIAKAYLGQAKWHHVYWQPKDQRYHYVLSEEVPGQTLDAFVASHPNLPLIDACQLFAATAREVARVHTLGFAHGDLHAGNIIIKDQDEKSGYRVRLIDFGMSYPIADGPYRNTIVAHPVAWCPEMLRNIKVDDSKVIGAVRNRGWWWVENKPEVLNAKGEVLQTLKEKDYGALTGKSDVWALWYAFCALLGGDVKGDGRFSQKKNSNPDAVFVHNPQNGKWTKGHVHLQRLKNALQSKRRVPSWKGFVDAVKRPCEALDEKTRSEYKQILKSFCESKLLNVDPDKRLTAFEVATAMESFCTVLQDSHQNDNSIERAKEVLRLA